MGLATIYYKPGCPFGIRLRMSLRLHGVPFRAVRFRDDEEGASRVREVSQGCEISPTALVDGRWLTNPHWSEVQRAADTATH
jgi:mycoredoxin